MNTPDFLNWVADRLVSVHGESPNVDFVLSLRERAEAMRVALPLFDNAAAMLALMERFDSFAATRGFIYPLGSLQELKALIAAARGEA